MSNFPGSLDDDVSLPVVNDNIVDVGADAINALRDAVFNIETNIGVGAAGSAGSIAARMGIALDAAGNIKPSAITSLGLVTLPITNSQISDSAQIPEHKLVLDHRTADLYNYITDLGARINTGLGWISTSGIKLEPHLAGLIYRHTLDQIDVNPNPALFLKNRFNLLRDNTNAFTAINDLNSEFLVHQFADGTAISTQNVTTTGGSVYPSSYAHTASGIFLNTSRFATIPQTATDLQQFANFIDSSSIFLLGTRIQNLYTSGISRVSRSSSLITDGQGPSIIPFTPAITHLLNNGTSSSPVDDIGIGDDIIEFTPAAADISSNSFDAKFALIKVGDVVIVNYGTVITQFLVKEKKYIASSGNKKYVIRINGKNLFYNASANVAINRPLFNNQKQGVLSVAGANNPITASLIIGNPRGAQTIGVGFNPDQIDSTHYNLYLVLYPTGNPADTSVNLPAIDITGNAGTTPGLYTLDSIVESTNNAFRQVGYNYRFTAYQYLGEFGIMLDSYGNAGFSIVSGVVNSTGIYDQTGSQSQFPNNVLDLFPATGTTGVDPLGIGPVGANNASPQFKSSYSSAEQSQLPTKVFLPLKRNNYYVNGVEKEKLDLSVHQSLDTFGDGYWTATVQAKNIFPSPAGRVQTVYRVLLDLSQSKLKIGDTIVVQSLGSGGSSADFGRFVIENVAFTINCTTNVFYTDITVYDAVHGTGISPSTTLAVGTSVALYFSPDSLSFNIESATDFTPISPFKRSFEIYIDQNGDTFSHERARVNISGSTLLVNSTIPLYTYTELAKLNIIKVSTKLRGYQFGSVTKITLNIVDFNNITGIFSGYLAFFDGSTLAHKGPLTSSRIGQVTRFYDESNIDFIDVLFDINTLTNNFSNQAIDFQLFPSLAQDDELMLLGICQYNDITKVVNYIKDERQFGNISEKDLSTSALNFISIAQKYLNSNGVIRGFDLSDGYVSHGAQIYLKGGVALVNGKFVQLNSDTVTIPIIKESFGALYNVNWLLCVNDKNEYQPIPLLDFDATVPTPNDSTRVFKALNLINGNLYSIDASTFSDVLNKRKDLTILYVVTSTTALGTGGNPPTISLAISDARKFVNDVDSNLPLKLTSSQSQGNFRNIASILNWIRFNNAFNGTAIVKGADINSGVVDVPLTLDFASSVVIDGQDNALLTFNAPVTFGSNVTIQNMTLTFNGGITINPSANQLTFSNCIITINVPSGTSPPLNTIFNFNGSNLITFTNCLINVVYTSLYDSTQIDRGAVFRVTNTANFKLDNCIIGVSYVVSAGVVTPGNMINLVNSAGAIIQNCIFTGNFNQMLNINSSPLLKFERSIVTSTYNPNAGGTPDSYNSIPYSSSNLVNSGQGYIYANISTLLDNIVINEVVFNYSPIVSNGNRYSFINFELSTGSALLSDTSITNCEFNHLNVGGAIEDLRPAISIINTAPASTSTAVQPVVANLNISNNICNRNQSIVLTSVTSSGIMVYPGLVTINCQVSNNICGTIGYWVSSGYKVVNTVPLVNIFTDKANGLLINNNICHYISNFDHTGKYFLVSKIVSSVTINQSNYPSGYVSVSGNRTNWIHVGISFEENSSLIISNNTLHAYDTTYLFNYNDLVPNAAYNPSLPGVGLSTGYAIFVSANHHFTGAQLSNQPGVGSDSSCVITGNTTETGYWLFSNSIATTYKYLLGYVYAQSSVHMTNNTFKGIIETSGFASLVLLGGKNNTVTNNRVYRSGTTVFSYITIAEFELPPSTAFETTGIIKNNFFDSFSLSTNLLPSLGLVNFSLATGARRWHVSENINQSVLGTVILLESMAYVTPYTGPAINAAMNPAFINIDSVNNGIDIFTGSGGFPAVPQSFSRRFYLNNYVPYGTPFIYSLTIVLTNNTVHGLTFSDNNPGDNDVSLTITNLNNAATFNVNLPDDAHFQSVLGTSGSTYFLNISPTATPGFDFNNFPLTAPIAIDFNISVNTKDTGATSPSDALNISPLIFQYLW